MGFSENGSKRAAVATNNAGAEQSMEWVLGHMEDPDFNDPLPGARLPATEDGGVTISAARSMCLYPCSWCSAGAGGRGAT